MATWQKKAGIAAVAVGVIAAGAWGVATTIWAPGSVTVYPGDQGVLTRADGAVSVLEPGLHFYNGAREEVVIYGALQEREHVVPAALRVGECAGDVTVVHAIGDVLAFHARGGDFALIEGVDAEIAQVVDGLDLSFGEPVSQALQAVRLHLREAMDNGLSVSRISVDFGDCAPVPPRIVDRRVERIEVETVGTLGTERVEIMVSEWITADDVRLQMFGVGATYDVTDDAAVQTCFGNSRHMIPARVEVLAQQELRRAIGTREMADLATALASVPDAQSTGVGALADCGVMLRALDYGDAVLWRMERINCDDTPDAQACRQ